MTGVISWFATWLIMILLLSILASQSWGKAIVYYLIWLAVAILLVTHADEITSLIDVKALQLNG